VQVIAHGPAYLICPPSYFVAGDDCTALAEFQKDAQLYNNKIKEGSLNTFSELLEFI